jgi:hypothetical protein
VWKKFSLLIGRLDCCCRCWSGVDCAAYWIFVGVWPFFFLGILTILFQTGKQGRIGHIKNEHVALTIFCSWNPWYRLRHPFPPEDDAIAPKDQFSAIRPNPALASPTH